MQGLYEEILEIPAAAKRCLQANRDLNLPRGVPYIGMGSSYFAPLTLLYCGADIRPQIASEYYYYLAGEQPLGVLISQSGESSETVWNLENFDKVVSLTNNQDSTLGTAKNLERFVDLESGNENYSSTKSYVNTLVALYQGLGFDPEPAINYVSDNFRTFEQEAIETAKQVAKYLSEWQIKGLYIIGSGPNYGTALEGALTLSETTKLTWVGMPVAQYDHGPKETAEDTLVIILNSHGKDQKRIEALKKTLEKSSACILELKEIELEENLSPLPLITRLNFIMNYLADEMKVGDTFELGGKVTTVEDSAK